MKTTLLTLSVGVLLCASCSTPHTSPPPSTHQSYHTSSVVTRAAEPSQYVVQFKILELGRNGIVDLVSSPRLMVKAGEEGQIKDCDRTEENGVFCTALVTEFEDRAEATTSVLIKSAGHARFVASESAVVR